MYTESIDKQGDVFAHGSATILAKRVFSDDRRNCQKTKKKPLGLAWNYPFRCQPSFLTWRSYRWC